MLNVSVGGVTFEGSPRDSGTGFIIGPQGWTGWDDGTAVRRESVERPGDHGSFAVRGYRSARVITIAGTILASSKLELGHMIDRFMGILADGGSGRMLVERPHGFRWANVMLTDMPTAPVIGASELDARFTIQFWSPDPRKYGESRDFPAGTPALHYGNFPAVPKLIVGSGSGGYTVTGPAGRQVVVASAPSDSHYIDFSSGGLFTMDGTRQAGAVTIYQPWRISPGETAGATISGSRPLVQRVTDTFI